MKTFKRNLDEMLKDFSLHKRDKEELLNKYIQDRLNESLANYYKEMVSSMNNLMYSNESNILKYLKED